MTTKLKRTVVATQGPFTCYRNEAGHYYFKLPGKRGAIYFQELPMFLHLVADVVLSESERIAGENKKK